MHQALLSQYHAALGMLQSAIAQCPDALWADTQYASTYGQIAYHTLYFTGLYLSANETAFRPWSGHRQGAQQLGKAAEVRTYLKPHVADYLKDILVSLESLLEYDQPDAPSGFEWLPFSRLELHLYNLRHIQHHTGQLIERLHAQGIQYIEWIGYRKP
jgi:hypothetical protein